MVDTKKIEDMELWTAESEIKEESEDVLQQFKKRFEIMKTAKAEVESEFAYADRVMYSKPQIRANWQIIPNMTMESALIEAYQWSKPAWLPIEVATEWRPDGIQTEMAKQTLQHFIRVEHIEEEINVRADYSKAKYWTCCLFSWLTVDSKILAVKWSNDYIADKKLKVRKIDQYHITIKDINPRNVRFDDVAKFDDAEDCIWKETISENMFKTRYFDWKWKPMEWYINLDHVVSNQYTTDWKKDRKDVVQLYHYYNKIMWYYWIIANENVVIYNWYAATQHGELPIIPIQHYYNDKRIWWDGIPKRYAVVKWINNNLITDIIWWARLNAGWLLVQWAWVATEWEVYIEPWEIEIVEMTEWNARDIQPINMQVNVWQLNEILTQMDDYWIILTGINFKAPYTSPAKTAFETSVMQEEQNNRLKTPAMLRDMWLSRAFNIMLCNIFQFAPYLYAERIRDQETWKSTEKDCYYIPLKWKRIVWKDTWPFEKVDDVSDKTMEDIIDIEDVDWYEDYFALSNKFYDTDKLLWAWQWLKVYIKTANTPATMKALEIENMTRYVQTKLQLLQAKALAAQWGGDVRDFEAIENKMDELFDIDPEHIMLKSNADKFKEQTAEITQAIMNMWQQNALWINTNNETNNQPWVQWLAWMQENSGQNIPATMSDIQGQWEQSWSTTNSRSRLS